MSDCKEENPDLEYARRRPDVILDSVAVNIAREPTYAAGLEIAKLVSDAIRRKVASLYVEDRDSAIEHVKAPETVDNADIRADKMCFWAARRGGYLLGLARAEQDPVTGILNRAGWNRGLDTAIASTTSGTERRIDFKYGILLIDMNGFKQINDAHTHTIGDKVLEHAAAILVVETRREDVVARLGGDEFGVLFKVPTDDSVDSIAEWLEVKRREMTDKLCTELVLPEQGLTIPFSASVGGTTIEPGQTSEDVMIKGDHEMYREKRASS